jgi:peptide-methionine (S)-S-oxide reductase
MAGNLVVGSMLANRSGARPNLYEDCTAAIEHCKNPNGYCGLAGTGVSCPVGLGFQTISKDA